MSSQLTEEEIETLYLANKKAKKKASQTASQVASLKASQQKRQDDFTNRETQYFHKLKDTQKANGKLPLKDRLALAYKEALALKAWRAKNK